MLKNISDFGDQMISIYNSNKKVYTITFQVTEDCNLCCSYCYQTNKTHNKMTFETAKKLIDYIFENKNNPDFFYNEKNTLGFIIDFIGGEPFLEIDLIEQIIEYWEQKFLENPNSTWLYCHRYSFSSNGTLYHTEKVQKFIKKYRPLLSISITVDGNKELHDSCRLFPDGKGSYDLAIKAALKEKEYGGDGTKITLSPDNINYLFNGIKNMVGLGFHYINVNCCFENIWENTNPELLLIELIKISNWIKENNLYDKIYITLLNSDNYTPINQEELNKSWCGAGDNGGMLALDYQGNYYPCIRFMKSSLGENIKPIIIGNNEHGLFFTKQEKNNQKCLQNCTRKNLSSEECLKCSIASGCSWCVGHDYSYYGNLNQKTNFICNMYKISALGTKYLTKIMNDKENFDKINLNYNMYNNIINKNTFYKINKWEE